MIAQVGILVRWEWFKTQRRRMPWVLLLLPLLFTQLVFWSTYSSYRAPIQAPGGMMGFSMDSAGEGGITTQSSVELTCSEVLTGQVPSETPPHITQTIEDFRQDCERMLEESREERRDLLRDITLPGSLVNALNLTQGFGVILIAIMTASVVGAEFGLGTMRFVLVKGAGRSQLMLAKLVLVAFLAGAALAIIAAAAAASSIIMGLLVSEQLEPPPGWGEAATTFGKAWFSLLPYIALAGLVALVASSSVAGLATAVAYLFTEVIFVGILINLFDWFQNVADYMLGRNITGWMMGGGREDPQISFGTSTPIGEFPDMLHAFLVLMTYTVVLVGLALWHFRRKDIGGARGA